MRQIVHHMIDSYITGVADSLNMTEAVKAIVKKDRTIKNVKICLLLNLVIITGSAILFEFIIKPFVNNIIVNNISPINSNTDNLDVNETEINTDNFLLALFKKINISECFDFFVNLFWLYPIYGLSLFINMIVYQNIADDVYEILDNKTVVHQMDYITMIKNIGMFFYRLLLTLMMIIQVMILSYIPYLGKIISFTITSLLYSFYCFEYKWNKQHIYLDKQMSIIENNCYYFLGFGTIISLSIHTLPFIIGNSIASTLFPLYIVIATMSDYKMLDHKNKVHLFSTSKFLVKIVLYVMSKF